MNATMNHSLETEFRYALDVMEARSHLGLDDEYASTLRAILLRRVASAESPVSARPAPPVRVFVPEDISA
ncbi:MAG TPA: hypothetical protein VMU48_10635 [Terracidiphilus sp.]|nr:hypothetical protein [Terracidiphilus sp.]